MHTFRKIVIQDNRYPWSNKETHIIKKFIDLNMNVIARFEFELFYDALRVQHVSHEDNLLILYCESFYISFDLSNIAVYRINT